MLLLLNVTSSNLLLSPFQWRQKKIAHYIHHVLKATIIRGEVFNLTKEVELLIQTGVVFMIL